MTKRNRRRRNKVTFKESFTPQGNRKLWDSASPGVRRAALVALIVIVLLTFTAITHLF